MKAPPQIAADHRETLAGHGRTGNQHHHDRPQNLMLLQAVSLPHQAANVTPHDRSAHLATGHNAQLTRLAFRQPTPIDNQTTAHTPDALGPRPGKFPRPVEPLSAAKTEPWAGHGGRHRSDLGQALTALAAAGVDDFASAPSGHARTETELALAADLRRLVLAFHG